MKNVKIKRLPLAIYLLIFIITLALIPCITINVLAEESANIVDNYDVNEESRSIYIGDLIDIKINSKEFTQDELRDKFNQSELEVVNIKDDGDGYVITLRSFEPGQKTVQVGDKELVITIKSTLTELERDEIFEGDKSVEGIGFILDWKYVFYILLALFLVSGGLVILKIIKKRKITILTPYQIFIKKINSILPDNNDCSDYFVKLTLCFKEYLELKFAFRIRGKTSIEIMKELSYVLALQEMMPSIKVWLEKSDYYKFSGSTILDEEKQKLYNEIVDIVKNINESNEGDV